MTGPSRAYVTPAPRRHGSLFSAPDLRSALELVRASPAPAGPDLAIWLDTPPPGQGPDVVVCVPVTAFENRRAQAEEVVARWDAVWLLVESVPRDHRAAAHQHLVDEISMALLSAAIEGVEDSAGEDDEDVGF